MTDTNGIEYMKCIVGNIISKHYSGEHREIKSGTRHFSAGTRVYCIFEFGGMGHKHVRVLGKHRKSFRMIDSIIRSEHIKNYRLVKVYTPRIIDFLKKHNQGNNKEMFRLIIPYLTNTEIAE